MVVKVFFSGISASKEVKKHQLRARLLLESYKIKYELVDISDPLCEPAREKMLAEAKRKNESVAPQPPQFYNDDIYCGDYEDLENANDNDELFQFLKLEEDITIENGNGDENNLFNQEQNTNGIHDDDDDDDDDKHNQDSANKKQKTGDDDDDEQQEEDVNEEVREQITVNGVVYDIPKDRKITIGGKVIDVDQLLQEEGDEIDLDQVDEQLKEGLISTDKNTKKPEDEDEDEEEADEDEEEEE